MARLPGKSDHCDCVGYRECIPASNHCTAVCPREDQQLEQALRSAAAVVLLPAILIMFTLIVAGKPILRIAYGEFYEAAYPIWAHLSIGAVVNVFFGSC